jgi:hypothetical protein
MDTVIEKKHILMAKRNCALLKAKLNININTKFIEYFDGVKVRIYRSKSAKDKILPALVFYHGGGWKYCSIGKYTYEIIGIAIPLPRIMIHFVIELLKTVFFNNEFAFITRFIGLYFSV